MRLTLFDLDNTLLAGDSDYLWGRFLVDEGVVDAGVYARENERFHAQYEAGNLDIRAYQRFALAPLLSHSRERMQALRADYVERVIRPLVARHTPALLDFHRQRGDLRCQRQALASLLQPCPKVRGFARPTNARQKRGFLPSPQRPPRRCPFFFSRGQSSRPRE